MTPGASAHADQLAAAAAHAEAMLRRQADTLGVQPQRGRPGRFVRRLLAEMDTWTLAGAMGGCEHMRQPGVRVLLAWDRRMLRCPECSVEPLARTRGGREDRTCDACRREAETIVPMTGAAGSVLVVFGLCRPCADAEGVAAT